MNTSTQTNIIHLEKRKGAQLQNETKKLDKKGHSSKIESRRLTNTQMKKQKKDQKRNKNTYTQIHKGQKNTKSKKPIYPKQL